jgi:hypothetical protein
MSHALKSAIKSDKEGQTRLCITQLELEHSNDRKQDTGVQIYHNTTLANSSSSSSATLGLARFLKAMRVRRQGAGAEARALLVLRQQAAAYPMQAMQAARQ